MSFGWAAYETIRCSGLPNADYWRYVLERGSLGLAANLTAEPGILGDGSDFIPVTVDRDEDETSYPCSLYTQYVRYPRGEIRLLGSGLTRGVARVVLRGLGAAMDAARVRRVVQWNSWLLSTNLLPPLADHVVATNTSLLATRFPKHAVLVKNVHGREDPDLPLKFTDNGYHLLPSRLIYFFDGKNPTFLKKSNLRQDLAALRKLGNYEPVEHHEFHPEDAPRVLRLYEMLYLEKHSQLNPRYTVDFIQKALKQRFLEFRGLRHSSGRIDAVFACFRRGNVLTTPYVGYDTSNTERHSFYRLLVAMLLKRVAEEGLLLNYSSGAGEFKRRRGGEACLEFNAVYTGHLPLARRLTFAALSACMRTPAAHLLSRVEI